MFYILVVGYAYWSSEKRKEELSEHIEHLTFSVDKAAKGTLINSPFPLIILETDGNVVWKSSKFVTEFADIDMDNYIDDLIIDIKDEIEKSDNKKRKSGISYTKALNTLYNWRKTQSVKVLKNRNLRGLYCLSGVKVLY